MSVRPAGCSPRSRDLVPTPLVLFRRPRRRAVAAGLARHGSGGGALGGWWAGAVNARQPVRLIGSSDDSFRARCETQSRSARWRWIAAICRMRNERGGDFLPAAAGRRPSNVAIISAPVETAGAARGASVAESGATTLESRLSAVSATFRRSHNRSSRSAVRRAVLIRSADRQAKPCCGVWSARRSCCFCLLCGRLRPEVALSCFAPVLFAFSHHPLRDSTRAGNRLIERTIPLRSIPDTWVSRSDT